MKIKAVRAKNFRTLEDFELRFEDLYCTISGQNNAGKTAVIRVIQDFFEANEGRYYYEETPGIDFARDHTQWSTSDDMIVSINVEIDRHDDSEVFFLIEKFTPSDITGSSILVTLKKVFDKDGEETFHCEVGDVNLDAHSSSEVFKKFRSANNLVVHNSTRQNWRLYYNRGGYTEIVEAHFSAEDRKRISDAERTLNSRVKQAAKQQKEELGSLLGKLKEAYQVELTTLDRGSSFRAPLSIKLNDRSVDVPLLDWGSGTQNRTRVLISILEAVRIRASNSPENRSTPVVVVEEPESFLHPSAQAEFGKVLNQLASELKIQIVATTHSPYMLNQGNPSANILLERKFFRGKPKETAIVEVSGDKWMKPFAECLGLVSSEFEGLETIFATKRDHAILVEGDLDKRYFDFLKREYPSKWGIPDHVDVIPYGGRDTLQNTQMLKFIIQKFDKVFVTFDLDSNDVVPKWMQKIGLEEGRDFVAVGVNKPGCECIEGYVPDEVKKKVFAENFELVSALTSGDGKARNSAKSCLKRKMIEALEKSPPVESDMKALLGLMRRIGTKFEED